VQAAQIWENRWIEASGYKDGFSIKREEGERSEDRVTAQTANLIESTERTAKLKSIIKLYRGSIIMPSSTFSQIEAKTAPKRTNHSPRRWILRLAESINLEKGQKQCLLNVIMYIGYQNTSD
jgi:hypothetical protein